MIKEVVSRNGMPHVITSTSLPSTYPSMNNSLKSNHEKHIMFANNTYQPMANVMNSNNSNTNNNTNNNNANETQKYQNNTNKYLNSINLCEKRWFVVMMICLSAMAVLNLIITFWIISALKLNDVSYYFIIIIK